MPAPAAALTATIGARPGPLVRRGVGALFPILEMSDELPKLGRIGVRGVVCAGQCPELLHDGLQCLGQPDEFGVKSLPVTPRSKA